MTVTPVPPDRLIVRHAQPAELCAAAEGGPAREVLAALVLFQPGAASGAELNPQPREGRARGDVRVARCVDALVVLPTRGAIVEDAPVEDAHAGPARLARPEDALRDLGDQLPVAAPGLGAPAELGVALNDHLEQALVVPGDDGTFCRAEGRRVNQCIAYWM